MIKELVDDLGSLTNEVLIERLEAVKERVLDDSRYVESESCCCREEREEIQAEREDTKAVIDEVIGRLASVKGKP